MEMIRTRNQQQAMPALLNTLFEGERRDENAVVDHPVVFTFEQPRERLIFWPGIRRNPAAEMAQALQSLNQTEPHLGDAAKAVLDGSENFLFHHPRLVVQVSENHAGRLNLYAVLADSNPFTGAFGQQGLQLSMLLELLANEARRQVGEMTIQHQRLTVPASVVSQLLKSTLDDPPVNPYDRIKPRKIDGPLAIADVLGDPAATMGIKSKFVRHVIGPLLLAGRAESAAEAAELAKKIKADDWRRAMVEWCEAVTLAQERRTDGD